MVVDFVRPTVGSVVVDHGVRGLFVRFIGWWVLVLIGLVAVALLPMNIVSYANRGDLSWAQISGSLAWFGIGLGILFTGFQLFRVRRSISNVYVVDDVGIVIKSRDQIDQRILWEEVTGARVDPILTQIQLSADPQSQPIVVMNGAAPYSRFMALRAIVESRAGSVMTLVRPSWPLRIGAAVSGLSVMPAATTKLMSGDWTGALMLGVGAFGIYFGITGMTRLYRSSVSVHIGPVA